MTYERKYTIEGITYTCDVELCDEEANLCSATDEEGFEVTEGSVTWWKLQECADDDLWDLLQDAAEFRADALYDQMKDEQL